MRLGMTWLLLAAMTPLAAAQEPSQPNERDDPMIVEITPERVDPAAELDAFLDSESYETEQDAVLSAAVAEALYRDGAYKEAKDVLEDAFYRIRKAGDSLSLGRVAAALADLSYRSGLPDDEMKYRLATVDSLEDALGKGHPHTEAARVALSLTYFKRGIVQRAVLGPQTVPGRRPESAASSNFSQRARLYLKDAEANMNARHGAGQTVAAYASLMRSAVDIATGFDKRALSALDDFLEHSFADTQHGRQLYVSANLLRLRALESLGREDEAQAAASTFLEGGSLQPIKPILLRDFQMASVVDNRSSPASLGGQAIPISSRFAGDWATIAFCVDSSGAVQDIEVVEERASKRFLKRLTEALATRRYIPAWADGQPLACADQIERFEVRATELPITGSRLRTAKVAAYIVSSDLTRDSNLGGGLGKVPEEVDGRESSHDEDSR